MCRVFGSHSHCRCSSATPQALRHSRFGFCCHGLKYCARILFQTRRDSSYQFEFTVFRNFFPTVVVTRQKWLRCVFFYFFHFWHLSRKHVNFCSRFLLPPAQCFIFPSQSQRSPFPLVPADLFGAGCCGVSAHIHTRTDTRSCGACSSFASSTGSEARQPVTNVTRRAGIPSPTPD